MRTFVTLVIASGLTLLGVAGCDTSSNSNKPALPLAQLSTPITHLSEDAGDADITVTLPTPLPENLTLDVVLLHIDTDDGDLVLNSSQVLIAAGATSNTFTITIIDDSVPEDSERFELQLRQPGNGAAIDSLILVIDDNDSTPAFPQQPASWPEVGVFAPASMCGDCHTASQPGESPAVMRAPHPDTATQPSPEGEDISPLHGWRHSAMAHAFTDPYFRAKMMHETEQFPHLAGFIENKCLGCHSPMAVTHAHQAGVSLTEDDSCGLPAGCYRAETAAVAPHAREGVSCTLCHQISDAVLTGTINSGNFEIDDSARIIFGPYQSPQGESMIQRSGYTPQYGLHMAKSELCASCHNLFTPTLDVETDLPNGDLFPEQTPFTEWQHSVYAAGESEERHCQDCHMGRQADDFLTRIAVRHNGTIDTGLPERTPFFSHDMVGGNTWLMEILEQFRSELGILNTTAAGGFTRKAELTRQFLGAAASLSADNLSLVDGVLGFDITIQNHGGHKLPTSFPSRRIWLSVRVTDGSGTVLFENGIPNVRHHLPADTVFAGPDCTAVRKPPGFDSSICFMPHITQVTAAEHIPIYESVMGATDGSITQVLLYAAQVLKDNRIPPRGFDNDTVPAEIAPTGIAGDTDFNANGSGSDTVSYLLDLSAADPAAVSVDVTLYYQTVQPSFITGLEGDHEWITQFRSMEAMVPPKAEPIATLTLTLP